MAEGSLLLRKLGFKASVYEQLVILSLTGGVPWYLEQINKNQTAQANIQRLFFTKNSPLADEFNKIFNDLFDKKSDIYKRLAFYLAEHGAADIAKLRSALNYPTGGALSQYLNHLSESGFIRKNSTWDFRSKKIRPNTIYRISDCYLKFYLRYLAPLRNRIINDSYEFEIASWQPQIGLQFEVLIQNNREFILSSLGISAKEILNSGYYYQKQTASKRGCQIDFLIQTSTKNLYICEFKFKNRTIGAEVIDEVQSKIKALKIPRGFAAIPVLITNADVSSSILKADYFHKIINVEEWMS